MIDRKKQRCDNCDTLRDDVTDGLCVACTPTPSFPTHEELMALSKDIDTLMADNPAPPSYPGADEEAAEEYASKPKPHDFYDRSTLFQTIEHEAFVAGSRYKESQMRERIEAAVKAERQRCAEIAGNPFMYKDVGLVRAILNPVADDSGVE